MAGYFLEVMDDTLCSGQCSGGNESYFQCKQVSNKHIDTSQFLGTKLYFSGSLLIHTEDMVRLAIRLTINTLCP